MADESRMSSEVSFLCRRQGKLGVVEMGVGNVFFALFFLNNVCVYVREQQSANEQSGLRLHQGLILL